MEILRVEDLNFAYAVSPEKTAVSNIKLSLEKGDFLCVCGPTGCGKSTFLKMLKRELIPNGNRSGRVLINGKSIDEMSERESASTVGFVMQRPEQQIVTDKVWHELAFGLENMGLARKEIRRRVSEMAGYFGIESWFEMSTDSLSGGQKQLLNLASVMVMQPELLILDEPTAQLDPIAASNFIATVEKMNRELALTVIMAEHRLEEIIPASNKIMVLEKGKAVTFGKTKECMKELQKNERMLKSMPAAVRICSQTGGSEDIPLSVCEGRRYIEDTFNNDIKSIDDVNAGTAERVSRFSKDGNPEKAYDRELALEFLDVYLRYNRNGRDVLRGMDLKIGSGEIFSILGGNGAGKSTAVSAAAGLVKPYSGTIKVFGKKIRDYRGQELYRNCVAMLPQDVQTVFTEDSINGRHPYDLSGGEQQLAALEIVLEADPRLLILDEPTKGLDVYEAERLIKRLEELKNGGVTIVIVTHDIEFAAKCSDRCALLFNGEITSCDETRRFFAGNYFYTTAANRMTRGYFENAVTVGDVVGLCRKNGRKDGGRY